MRKEEVREKPAVVWKDSQDVLRTISGEVHHSGVSSRTSRSTPLLQKKEAQRHTSKSVSTNQDSFRRNTFPSNQNRRVIRRVMAGETPPYTQWSTAAGASRYGGRLVYKRYWGITRHRRKAMYRDTLEENLGRRWTSRQDNDPKLTATITQGGPTFPDFNPTGKVDLWEQRAPRNHGDSKTIW